MIHFINPWTTDKNLGKFYNDQFDRVDDEDWIGFIDGDACFTGHFWGKIIEDTIKSNPQYELFTCMTNRVGTKYQCVPLLWDAPFERVWLHGEEMASKPLTVTDITDRSPISGVFILLSKRTWQRVGGFEERGMLGVDNSIHYRVRDNGGKVGMMNNLVVYHYYRGGNMANSKHLR